MTNPLTSREAPDPMTLTGFSKRSQSEIDHNLFAAKTGGLVAISAPSFWEMYYAAQAWHEHVKASPAPLDLPPYIDLAERTLVERVRLEYDDENRAAAIKAMRGWSCRDTGPLNADGSRQFAVHERAIAQASDTTPSVTSKES